MPLYLIHRVDMIPRRAAVGTATSLAEADKAVRLMCPEGDGWTVVAAEVEPDESGADYLFARAAEARQFSVDLAR